MKTMILQVVTQPENGWVVLTAISTLTYTLAAVAGFYYLNKQMRHMRRSINSQTYQSIYSRGFENMELLLEYPELRPYFYENKSIRKIDPMEYQKVMALSEIILDFFEHLLAEKETFTPENFEHWKWYMRDIYSRSEAMRVFLADKEDYYNRELLEIIRVPNKREEVRC